MERGKLIYTLGGEGSGKSAHSILIEEGIARKGISIIRVREPGGTPVAEKIRNVLLNNENEEINFWTELLLFQASRSQLHSEKIIPYLKSGVSVIQDRSKDCSTAYQGYGRRVNLELITRLNRESTFGYNPDLAFIIDIDPEIGLKKEQHPDRMSVAGLEFHQRVRQGYLEIAKQNSKNYVVIPYIEHGLEEMQGLMKPHIDKLFNF